MKTYARIQSGRVAELLTTLVEPGNLFHPSLVWVDVSKVSAIEAGWSYDGDQFAPADPPQPIASSSGSIAELQLRVAELSARIAALANAA